MEFPEQFQQRVVVEIQPGLDSGELLDQLGEIAAPFNRHARSSRRFNAWLRSTGSGRQRQGDLYNAVR
jgi:hypothetical protein